MPGVGRPEAAAVGKTERSPEVYPLALGSNCSWTTNSSRPCAACDSRCIRLGWRNGLAQGSPLRGLDPLRPGRDARPGRYRLLVPHQFSTGSRSTPATPSPRTGSIGSSRSWGLSFQDRKRTTWSGRRRWGRDSAGALDLQGPAPRLRPDERYKAACVVNLGRRAGLVALASPERLAVDAAAQRAPSSPTAPFGLAQHCLLRHGSRLLRGLLPRLRPRRAPDQAGDVAGLPALDPRRVSRPWSRAREHSTRTPPRRTIAGPTLILMFPKRFLEQRPAPSAWPYQDCRTSCSWPAATAAISGAHFWRPSSGPGPMPGNWHERAIEVGQGLVPTGDGEMSLYVVEN